jgi:hypothetical protein
MDFATLRRNDISREWTERNPSLSISLQCWKTKRYTCSPDSTAKNIYKSVSWEYITPHQQFERDLLSERTGSVKVCEVMQPSVFGNDLASRFTVAGNWPAGPLPISTYTPTSVMPP